MQVDPIREEVRWRALEEAARLVDALVAETDEWHSARALADAAQHIRDLKKGPSLHGA